MFLNRKDAGQALASRLEEYQSEEGVVLAIPRGGVPIGLEIAKALDWPLEVALSKKIGHPTNKEYAIGAASLSSYVLNPEISVSPDYLESELSRIREKLRQYHQLYFHHQQPVAYGGKIVILTDDGVATGHTLLSIIALIRANNPGKLVVAIPVAPPEAVRKISRQADSLLCLEAPEDFRSVGQFYQDFEQIEDHEVTEMLQTYRNTEN
ncbi:MAG: phosphoribosyltransferase [Bacteroidetes bacterium]|nr:phosphoribosyltransferase [Bacteroidota bacterium]